MRKFVAILATVLTLALAVPAAAQEVKRYKPILIPSDDSRVHPPKVLIVDTKEGHVWLLEQKVLRDSPFDYYLDSHIVYHGKVVPGKVGEAVSGYKGK